MSQRPVFLALSPQVKLRAVGEDLFFACRRDSGEVIDLDPMQFAILSRCDGTTDLSRIAAELGAGDLSPLAERLLLRDLVEPLPQPLERGLAVNQVPAPHLSRVALELAEDPGAGLDDDQLVRVIDQLDGLNVLGLDLVGREPLARPGVWDLIQEARGSFLPITSVTTQGAALDRESLDRLAVAGLGSVVIPLAGPNAAAHEALMGPGSFAPAWAALELTLERGLWAAVRTPVTRANRELLGQMYDLLGAHHNLVWQVGAPPGLEMGAALPPGQEVDDAEALTALLGLMERYLAGDETGGAAMVLEVGGVYFSKLFSGRPLLADRPASACCDCGEALYIAADGRVHHCAPLAGADPEASLLGRLPQDDLAELWYQRRSAHPLAGLGPEDLEGCEGCRLVRVCAGGCRAYARLAGAELTDNDPRACRAALGFEEQIIPLLDEELARRWRELTRLGAPPPAH